MNKNVFEYIPKIKCNHCKMAMTKTFSRTRDTTFLYCPNHKCEKYRVEYEAPTVKLKLKELK